MQRIKMKYLKKSVKKKLIILNKKLIESIKVNQFKVKTAKT
jgi:hypothetical protein